MVPGYDPPQPGGGKGWRAGSWDPITFPPTEAPVTSSGSRKTRAPPIRISLGRTRIPGIDTSYAVMGSRASRWFGPSGSGALEASGRPLGRLSVVGSNWRVGWILSKSNSTSSKQGGRQDRSSPPHPPHSHPPGRAGIEGTFQPTLIWRGASRAAFAAKTRALGTRETRCPAESTLV